MQDRRKDANDAAGPTPRSSAWSFVLLGACVLAAAGCRMAEREMADRTPAGCAKCHVQIAQQWDESAHARAWTNPEFVERTSQHEVQHCLPCHAPRPLLERPAGEPPELRSAQREFGVDCRVCHQLGCGYAGPYRSHLGPHPTQQDTTRLPCPDFCGSCHAQEHQEYVQLYRATTASGAARSCVECHMPSGRSRLTQGHALSYIHPQRTTHDHGFPTWTAEVAGGAVEIEAPTITWHSSSEAEIRFALTNRGAGHSIPSGAFGHRELRIAVELQDEQGQTLGQQEVSVLVGQPNCLPPGQRVPFSLALSLPKRAQPVRGRLTVERVNREGSFRYVLAERAWPVATEPRASVAAP